MIKVKLYKYDEFYEKVVSSKAFRTEEEIKAEVLRLFDELAEEQLNGSRYIEKRTYYFLTNQVIDSSTYRWINNYYVQSFIDGKVYKVKY